MRKVFPVLPHPLKISKAVGFFILIYLLSSCAQLGTIAAKLMTQKTDDLENVAVTVRYMQNLYTPATKTTEATYLPEFWKEGSNAIIVNFLKRKGVGMYYIDGTVTIDGEVVPHITNGAYVKAIDTSDKSVKKVVIETTKGQRVEYEIGPIQPVSILSLNGVKRSDLLDASKPVVEIDLQKDFELELSNPKGSADSDIKISMIGDIMGVRAFTEVAVIKAGNKLIIPSAIFNNPAGSLLPNMGDNYIQIERFKLNDKQVSGVGATQAISISWDVLPVKLVGTQEKTAFGVSKNIGVQVKKEIETPRGKMDIDFSKPNAFLGRPFSSGKKFAVVSFTLRATKLQQQKVSSSESTSGNVKTTTTTTATRTFPKLPDAYWDDLVEKLYKDVESVLLSTYDMKLIPIEKVLQSPSYQLLDPVPDELTVVEVSKSYKGTKYLLPTNITSILNNVSSTFASDRPDARLIRELGVDGIIAVTVDLSMPWEEFTLAPKVSVRITGGPNGYTAGPTVFAQGTISGNGVPLDAANMDAKSVMDVLPKVIRRDDLKMALRTAFKELDAAEKDKGYDRIWALK